MWGTTTAPSDAPRRRTTRRSPSRSSTMFRSLACINLTMRSRRLMSMGPVEPEDFFDPAVDPPLPPFFFVVFFSLKMAILEFLIQRREDFTAAVGDEHIVFD